MNRDLAARCRALADEQVSDPLARKAALCVGVCFQETKTLTAARRMLTEIRVGPVRKAAVELFDHLTREDTSHG
ncbi:MAG: hypothetical protein JWN52_8071 [Actinomycetia bacterium]|nr:hypothetical protein [Actinomycetes bacterium]